MKTIRSHSKLVKTKKTLKKPRNTIETQMQFQSEGSTRKIGQINEKISKTHSQPKTHQPEGSKRKTKVRLGKSRGFLTKKTFYVSESIDDGDVDGNK